MSCPLGLGFFGCVDRLSIAFFPFPLSWSAIIQIIFFRPSIFLPPYLGEGCYANKSIFLFSIQGQY